MGEAVRQSLAEAMAYLSGITSRMGKVDDGNTVSDFDKEEIKRQISINTSVVPIEWEGYKINILDTPGLLRFCRRSRGGNQCGRRSHYRSERQVRCGGRNPEGMGAV